MTRFNQLQAALEEIGFKPPKKGRSYNPCARVSVDPEFDEGEDSYETHMRFETRKDVFI